MESVIQIKNVSKKYKLVHKKVRYQTMRDTLSYAMLNPIGHAKNLFKKFSGRDTKEEFWALRDINLDIQKGEVLGIIGRNGAGKSTLLKILTGITPPSDGEIDIRGKVASLLEVGTGFHPELTGRENIFLNGAILGMTRKEIERKFDQIVEFSGIEQFLDTPVKRYSSGMYVRLAFSVAAHMEPDILLVDEVLAVGDAEFQKKCLGKMDEVTKAAGRTILFVSHNMDAIKRLCPRTVLLEKGRVAAVGETEAIVDRYLNSGAYDDKPLELPQKDEGLSIEGFSVTQNNKETRSIDSGKPFEICIDFSLEKDTDSLIFGINLKNIAEVILSRSYLQDWNMNLQTLKAGRYSARLSIPEKLLLSGDYHIELKAYRPRLKVFFAGKEMVKTVRVTNAADYYEAETKNPSARGYFIVNQKWDLQKNYDQS